jgi:hypothetical protein
MPADAAAGHGGTMKPAQALPEAEAFAASWAVFGRLARRMSYLHGDVTDAALCRRLGARIGRAKRPLYYLEVPPALFGPVCGSARASRPCRSRWPRTSASRAAAGSAIPPARCATWSRTTCFRSWPWPPWTRRRGGPGPRPPALAAPADG